MIIMRLPQRKVLATAMRVSRYWKEVIDSSPNIQKLLMFAPDSLEVIKPDMFDESPLRTPIYSKHLQMNTIVQQTINPVALLPKTIWASHRCGAPDLGRDGHRRTLCITWRQEPPRSGDKHASGSWRRMFLSTPPCEMVHCMIIKGTYEEKSVEIKDTEGVKLGLVEDIAQAALAGKRSYAPEDVYKRGDGLVV